MHLIQPSLPRHHHHCRRWGDNVWWTTRNMCSLRRINPSFIKGNPEFWTSTFSWIHSKCQHALPEHFIMCGCDRHLSCPSVPCSFADYCMRIPPSCWVNCWQVILSLLESYYLLNCFWKLYYSFCWINWSVFFRNFFRVECVTFPRWNGKGDAMRVGIRGEF